MNKILRNLLYFLKKAFLNLKNKSRIVSNEGIERLFKNDFEVFFSYNIQGNIIISPNEKMVPILYNHIFEKEIYKFKSKSSQPKILDCGSNIGMAILYWKKIYPDAEIIAFEPSIMNFKALKYNIEKNSISNIELVNAAISSNFDIKQFTDNDAASGSLFLEKELDKKYEVNTVRLDGYLNKEIDFLKIDIEGEEINILDQIETNLSNINNLFIEYHSFINKPQKLSLFLAALEKANFRYYIEGEYSHKAPLFSEHVKLQQDLQVAIWAKKI